MNKIEVKKFVKNELGCLCSDEVFSKIEILENFLFECGCNAKYKINIGDRLLVVIIYAAELEGDRHKLKSIASEGKQYRDDNNFNRFRLVILSKQPKSDELSFQTLFREEFGNDDKMHLHIIHENTYPDPEM